MNIYLQPSKEYLMNQEKILVEKQLKNLFIETTQYLVDDDKDEKFVATNFVIFLMCNVSHKKIHTMLEVLYSENNIIIDWCAIFKQVENEALQNQNNKVLAFLINLTCKNENHENSENPNLSKLIIIDRLSKLDKVFLKKHIFDSIPINDLLASQLLNVIYTTPCASSDTSFQDNFCQLLRYFPREITHILRLAKDKVLQTQINHNNTLGRIDYLFSQFILYIIWQLKYLVMDETFQPFQKMVNGALKGFLQIFILSS